MQQYVIYHIASTHRVGPTKSGRAHSLYFKPYATRGAALRTMAKFNAQEAPDLIGPGPYGVCTAEHHATHVRRMVERTNLLSGQKFTEASDTPGYCSPSSEAYWSM